MSRSIEPPPPPSLSDFSFRSSKSRVYSGSSSKCFMDPDVIEIPPPILNSSNSMKQKEVMFRDVIDIDNDDDSADLVLVGEKLGKNNKGKEIESIHGGYGDPQTMEVFDVDGDDSDQSCHDDYDCSEFLFDEYMHVDEYTSLQAHFDNVNIPPGIEAPVPWLTEHGLDLKKAESSSLNPCFHPQQSDSTLANYLAQPTWLINNPGPSAGASSFETKMDAIDHPSKIKLSSQLFSQTVPSKKRNGGSHFRSIKTKKLAAVESSKSNWFLGPSDINKPNGIGFSANHGFFNNSKPMNLPHGGESSHWKLLESAQKEAGSMSTYHHNIIGPVNGSLPLPGTEFAIPSLSASNLNPFSNYTTPSSFFIPFVPLHTPPGQMYDNFWVHNPSRDGNHGIPDDSTVVTISDEVRAEILKKFQNFKQFDTIDDTSDHYFVGSNSSMNQHSKSWGKKIQEEWKLLEKDLPDSIFVRVYESRIDLLRAVIIGAEGTPYHDGLFFFDVFFPSGYPNVPPQVHYHSCGLRLNPNLYNCGKVCLSLLNTWSGSKNEKWLPGVSTILQVLVSIQGLILNTKPYFNEPGYARLSGSANGEMKSLRYNEDTFLLSLKTMVYLIRKPPKHFEDFVIGHFSSRAHDILVATKAYMDGAQVGCLVKGGVQDVDQGDRSCSKEFKTTLPIYVDMLVKDFAKIGAKDCEKFLSSSTAKN